MNPAEVLRIVAEGPENFEDDVDLTPAQRRFCELKAQGETNRGAYMEAFGVSNPDTASTNSTDLLKVTKIKKYLDLLFAIGLGPVGEKARPWVELLPKAQAIVLATAEGRLRSRLQYEAACYLINRALGLPSASLDVTITAKERVEAGTKAFTARLAKDKEHREHRALPVKAEW